MQNKSIRSVYLVVAVLSVTACWGNSNPLGPGSNHPPLVHPPSQNTDAPALDTSIFAQSGDRTFLTANQNELVSEGTVSYNKWGTGNAHAELADDADAAAECEGGMCGAPSESGGAEPEPDPTREIVEADLFKVEGNLVYVLNRYRGLVIIDISQPDDPRISGRLPFQAVPVEMYVRDGRAYIVMSDYFVYWMYDPDADPLGFHGSQILIADVSDPAAPFQLGSLPVDGEVTDTRMVGDAIYAVSKRRPDYWRYNTADWEDTTWVVSLDIADPGNIREVERIEFQGTSTLIHATHHAIFVAATDPNYYLYDSQNPQETLVTYVDISDPHGDIRQRGHIYIPGYIADKFKMDYYDSTFRVLSQGWYGDSNMQLSVVDTSRPDEMEIIGTLSIPTSGWGYMRATRFSDQRAYVMTYRYENSTRYYDLHTIDLSDPATPYRASILPIDGDVSHFEVRNENTRVLALGRSTDYQDYRTQLTLFDVEDAAHPVELSRIKLGERYSSSTANNDYKALKVLDDLGLILLPLNYWNGSQYFTGSQLVDWQGDSLIERGRVDNFDTVQRVFPAGDRLVAMSTFRVQVIDARNRDNPVVTAALDLIHNVYDIFDIQGHQVQLVGDPYQGGVLFSVIPFDAEDDAEPLASIQLPYTSAPVCMQRGDLIHLVGYEKNRGQVIHTVDFSDLLSPRLRGDLALASEIEHIYSYGYSYYYHYWSPYSGMPLENRILPFSVRELVEDDSGRRDWVSHLRLIDLSDPDKPRVAEARLPMNDFPFINKVTHGTRLCSTHVEQATTDTGASLLYHVRSFLDRIDVSDVDHPEMLPSINVPGYLIDTSDDGKLVYTIDYQWDDFGRRRNSVNVLRIDGDDAVLMEVLPISDQVNRAVFRDRTIWVSSHKYPWWGVHSDTVASRQPYTVLDRIQIGDAGNMAGFASARIHGYHFDLLDVTGELIYLSSRYPYGLLVLDASDPADPTIVNSARSVGYISRMLVHDNVIFSPMGYFGVRKMASLP